VLAGSDADSVTFAENIGLRQVALMESEEMGRFAVISHRPRINLYTQERSLRQIWTWALSRRWCVDMRGYLRTAEYPMKCECVSHHNHLCVSCSSRWFCFLVGYCADRQFESRDQTGLGLQNDLPTFDEFFEITAIARLENWTHEMVKR